VIQFAMFLLVNLYYLYRPTPRYASFLVPPQPHLSPPLPLFPLFPLLPRSGIRANKGNKQSAFVCPPLANCGGSHSQRHRSVSVVSMPSQSPALVMAQTIVQFSIPTPSSALVAAQTIVQAPLAQVHTLTISLVACLLEGR
jgi:hypothetical protein